MLAAHKIAFLESGLLTAALCVVALAVGMLVGGALYTLAWRLTHRRVVLTMRCRCPECGHPLALREMIPVVSWVLRQGTCEHCGRPISVAYPTSELLGAGIFASVVLRYGLTAQTCEIAIFAFLLFFVSLTSLWDYSIPNECILTAVLVRIAYLVWVFLTEGTYTLAISSLVGFVALGLPLLVAVFLSNAMLVRDMTGFGTVKLVAVVGLYLGWQQGLLAIGMAFGIGLIVWLVSPNKLMTVEVDGGVEPITGEDAQDGEPAPLQSRPSREEDIAEPMRLIPFAPSIALACWVMLLIGASVSVWNAPLL